MRKILLALLFIPLFAFTQENHVVKEYCWVFYGKPKAQIMYGDSKQFTEITDSTGNAIKFNNHIHLLNYMSERGWEVLSVPNQNGVNTYLNQFHFYRPKKKEK